jgi:hypothetical protein
MALRGQAANSTTSPATSVTVTVSGIGILANDIVIFMMNSNSPTLTPPSGFNPISGITQISGIGGSTALMMWYLVAGGSEPSTYTATASSSDLQTGVVCVFSGRSTSSIFDATQTQAAVGGPSPVGFSFTGFTPSQAGDDLLVFVGTNNFPTVYASPLISASAPAGFANSINSYGSVAYSPVGSAISNQAISASATGTISGVETWTANTNEIYIGGFMVALSPTASNSATIAWIT